MATSWRSSNRPTLRPDRRTGNVLEGVVGDPNPWKPSWWLVLLLAGYILLLTALDSGYKGPDVEFAGSPTCGGDPMSPGDVCTETRIGRRSSIESHSYEERLALARSDAKHRPWSNGMFMGVAGSIVVFVGIGRHLVVRKRRSRRRAAWYVVVGATVPLLAVAAVLWPLELRYDIEHRNEFLLMSSFRPDVPDTPFLTAGLALVGTAITLTMVLDRHLEHAVFGMGDFWGAQRLFSEIEAVNFTVAGYAGGGRKPAPATAAVRARQVEVVRVAFDPDRLSYEQLLKVFWENHDPTQRTGQGRNIGPRYRSVIYATTEDQLATALASRDTFARVVAAGGRGQIITEIAMLDRFISASERDQHYLRRNPNEYSPIAPNGLVYPTNEPHGAGIP